MKITYRKKTPLLILLAAAVGILPYSNILCAFFLADDFDLLRGIAVEGPFSVLMAGSGGFFRPVVSLSFALDILVWGLNPAGFHFFNVFLHFVNSLLVGYATTLLLKASLRNTNAQATGWISGLMFLAMPCHSEPVSWISGRMDLLAAFFALVSLSCFLRFKKDSLTGWYAVSLVAFFLALLSKESVVAYPAVMVIVIALISLYERTKGRGHPFREAGGFFLVFGCYLVVRYCAIGTLLGGYGTHGNIDPWFIFKIVSRAPAKILVTLHGLKALGLDYWITEVYAPIGIGLTLASAATVTVLGLQRHPRMSAFLTARLSPIAVVTCALATMFLISMAPVANLPIPLGDLGNDRLLYWPSVFMAVFVAIVIQAAVRSAGAVAMLVAVMVAGYGVSSYCLNENWRLAGIISKNIVEDVNQLISKDKN
ncbi:MAG: hypothetical protein V2B18_24065, partial [Pseudomonadota bacterium]